MKAEILNNKNAEAGTWIGKKNHFQAHYGEKKKKLAGYWIRLDAGAFSFGEGHWKPENLSGKTYAHSF